MEPENVSPKIMKSVTFSEKEIIQKKHGKDPNNIKKSNLLKKGKTKEIKEELMEEVEKQESEFTKFRVSDSMTVDIKKLPLNKIRLPSTDN